MLVLSRKVGDRIVINEKITVVVNHISGKRVSLGIEAPQNVEILRGELVTNPDTSQHVRQGDNGTPGSPPSISYVDSFAGSVNISPRAPMQLTEMPPPKQTSTSVPF
ncbi:MAG: carbon storage regulator [Pirellulaceae bacterium]|nr:carbon storage regulator [Pirellulaceae bacterium]